MIRNACIYEKSLNKGSRGMQRQQVRESKSKRAGEARRVETTVGALRFIGFQVMSSLAMAGKLKARRSENVGENCGCTRTHTQTETQRGRNAAGALGLKTTSSGGTGEQAAGGRAEPEVELKLE